MAKSDVQRLKQETDPMRRCSLALALLRDRLERQVIDEALAALRHCPLDDAARLIISSKAAYYFDHHEKDEGGHLREALIQLLAGIGHLHDIELFRRGIETFEKNYQGIDITDMLRAASLRGMARVNPQQVLFYAIRLMCDTVNVSRFSGEPAVTAIEILASLEQRTLIYQFLLSIGTITAPEATAKAFDTLAEDFPVDLYQSLVEPYLASDHMAAEASIARYIVGHRREALYPILEMIMRQTQDKDLHRYIALDIIAAGDNKLMTLLETLAKTSLQKFIPNFIQTFELSNAKKKEALHQMLTERLKSK